MKTPEQIDEERRVMFNVSQIQLPEKLGGVQLYRVCECMDAISCIRALAHWAQHDGILGEWMLRHLPKKHLSLAQTRRVLDLWAKWMQRKPEHLKQGSIWNGFLWDLKSANLSET